jgi:hypothetical protein
MRPLTRDEATRIRAALARGPDSTRALKPQAGEAVYGRIPLWALLAADIDRDDEIMPPVSQKQRAAMQAAAHGKGTLGISKTVAKEFVAADPGGKLPKRKPIRKVK